MSHISQRVREAKTAGAMFELALSMKDPKDRQTFIREYCTLIIETSKKEGQTITVDDARDILRSNLGYFAGYYGDDVRKEIEEMYGAPHPVLGSIITNVRIRHPMQPVVLAKDGTPRFKENPIVRFLLDNGGFDMNKLAVLAQTHGWTDDDRSQLAQLIGYSTSGFGDLSYAREDHVAEADRLADMLREKRGKST